MRVNLSDVQEFDAVPAGTYHVAITDGSEEESGPNSKNPGSVYLKWEMTIQDEEFKGRKVWLNTSMLPQALFGLKGLLRAVDPAGTTYDLDEDIEFEIADLVGAELMVKVTKRDHNGNDVNDVKKCLPLGEGSEKSSSLLP